MLPNQKKVTYHALTFVTVAHSVHVVHLMPVGHWIHIFHIHFWITRRIYTLTHRYQTSQTWYYVRSIGIISLSSSIVVVPLSLNQI